MVQHRIKVASAPAERALLIYDGECTFCCWWIERWKMMTGERVDYAPFQKVAECFPEIPLQRFKTSVQLITPEGKVYEAAEAVYKALENVPKKGWAYSLYQHWPFFAKASEIAYTVVAHNRYLFSFFTRLLWGKNSESPTYLLSSYLFIKLLGAIALVALISFWVQALGLIGSEGILPLEEFLEKAEKSIEQRFPGEATFFHLPTLFWWESSDTAIHVAFVIGTVASIALILGFCPPLAALALWLLYLSLTIAGQDFLSFQWDILLVEVSFLTIFFSPWKLWDRLARHTEPSSLARCLLWFLLFRLMFESGMVKLQSFGAGGENTWRDLTALNYHYWSQPLPTWMSWYAHHLPHWFHQLCLGILFVVELVLPFFILGPRRLRNTAFLGLVFLQVMICLTGNYGFFNLLTLLLCLSLVDDQSLPWLRCKIGDAHKNRAPARGVRLARRVLLLPFAFTIVAIGLFQLYLSTEDTRQPRKSLNWLEEHPLFSNLHKRVQPFRVVNNYGLFRVMTTTRPEIIISGSKDGQTWKTYPFKWKPVDPAQSPQFLIPHMPRLDWRLWFEGLSYERSRRFTPWFRRFLEELFKGNPKVLALLKENPFPEYPPRYLRIQLYHYTFSDPPTRRETGHWWDRKLIEAYTVTGSLNQGRG